MAQMCQNCGKRAASYHSVRNINGNIRDIRLCRECYEEMLYNPKISDIAAFVKAVAGAPADRVVKCPACGTSIEEFKRTLFVGCGECYVAFEPMMAKLLGAETGGVVYSGKINSDNDIPAECARLEAELQRAVSEERYEDAGLLHARLRALKGESERT